MPEHFADTLEVAGDRFERGTAVLRQIGGREFDGPATQPCCSAMPHTGRSRRSTR
jgi:hypothetical protein